MASEREVPGGLERPEYLGAIRESLKVEPDESRSICERIRAYASKLGRLPLDVLLFGQLLAADELLPGPVRIEALETRQHRQVLVLLGVEILVSETRGHELVDNLRVVISAYIHDVTVVRRDPLDLHGGDRILLVVILDLCEAGREVEGDDRCVVELLGVGGLCLLPTELDIVDLSGTWDVVLWGNDFGNINHSLADVVDPGDNLSVASSAARNRAASRSHFGGSSSASIFWHF